MQTSGTSVQKSCPSLSPNFVLSTPMLISSATTTILFHRSPIPFSLIVLFLLTPSNLQQPPFSSASRYQTYYDAKRKEHPQALCLNGTLRNWVKWGGWNYLVPYRLSELICQSAILLPRLFRNLVNPALENQSGNSFYIQESPSGESDVSGSGICRGGNDFD